jgi:hypothetical protein
LGRKLLGAGVILFHLERFERDPKRRRSLTGHDEFIVAGWRPARRGKIANGLIEGINSLVQAAKSKARGYRSIRNLKAMVYLLAGKLDMRLPGKHVSTHPQQRGTTDRISPFDMG